MTRHKNSDIIDEDNNKLKQHLPGEDSLQVIDIYDEENSYSVINLAPAVMKRAIRVIPQELRVLNQEELRDLVKPGQTLNQIRLRFWAEYDRVLSGQKNRMSTVRIIAGICSAPVFSKTMWNREKLAWILTPVSAYSLGVEEIMETTLYKLRKKIDDVDIESTKDLAILLRIFETFDKRVHGDYKQTKEITIKEEPKGSAEIRDAINVKKELLID